MATPNTEGTLNSLVSLGLSSVPDVSDPEVYRALLDIHNAIEILLAAEDDTSQSAEEYIDKKRSVVLTGAANYSVLDTDGLILLSGASNVCTANLPSAASYPGYRFSLKCVADTNAVYVATAGVETIDTDAANFQLWKDEIIEIQSDGTNWWII